MPSNVNHQKEVKKFKSIIEKETDGRFYNCFLYLTFK